MKNTTKNIDKILAAAWDAASADTDRAALARLRDAFERNELGSEDAPVLVTSLSADRVWQLLDLFPDSVDARILGHGTAWVLFASPADALDAAEAIDDDHAIDMAWSNCNRDLSAAQGEFLERQARRGAGTLRAKIRKGIAATQRRSW